MILNIHKRDKNVSSDNKKTEKELLKKKQFEELKKKLFKEEWEKKHISPPRHLRPPICRTRMRYHDFKDKQE